MRWELENYISKDIDMAELPFTLEIHPARNFLPSKYDNYFVRRLSMVKNSFLCQDATNGILLAQDPIVYEVYEVKRPEITGELMQGISIVHPGKVGDEYYMTKGHFHIALETAEVYFCLHGQGFLVMETPEGDCAVEPMQTNTVLYVPPRWAHRSVNTSCSEDLVTFFVYPAEAGHDYSSIEKRGYRKLIVECDGIPIVVDNPRWLPKENQ
jgi:glucose-6-phosphate isomerase